MVKNNVKKLIICIIAITMVLVVATRTFASQSGVLNELMAQNTNASNINGNTEYQNIAEGQRTNNTVGNESNVNNANQSLANSNSNKNVNAPTTTPYTGIGDYSTYIFIGIFVVSAIYAYKKVREY